MGKYIKRVDTKATIIEACEKLFYEKGYIGTHYEDIVEATGIKAGLIHYHFRKKMNIAEIIYHKSASMHYSVIKEALEKKFDFEIIDAVETRSYWHLIFEYENFKRFCYETYLEQIPAKESVVDVHRHLKPYAERYNLDVSEDYLKLVRLSSSSMQMDALINFIDGRINLTEEEFVEFDIRLMYDILNIDKDHVEEVLSVSKEVFSKLEITLKPYFKVVVNAQNNL